jgi:transposase
MLDNIKKAAVPVPLLTIGLDVGDKSSFACVVDPEGNRREVFSFPTDSEGLTRRFARPTARVVLEAGPHSRWISKRLSQMGHEVLVVDPRKLGLIAKSQCKTDRRDAEILALFGLGPRKLLGEVTHRSEEAQADLAVLLTRDHFVRQRTMNINRVRGVLKSYGIKVPRMSTSCFHSKAAEYLPSLLLPALLPILDEILSLQVRIKRLGDEIKKIALRYPQTERLTAIYGIGTIISLAYVLSMDDPKRFKRSRDVGPFFGLVPRTFQTGITNLQLSISRSGNPFIRRSAIQAAQCVLRENSPDCDLKRYGKKIEERGGKYPKKRAVVAVARKLVVLMHQLLVDPTPYDPWYSLKRAGGTPPEPVAMKTRKPRRSKCASSRAGGRAACGSGSADNQVNKDRDGDNRPVR